MAMAKRAANGRRFSPDPDYLIHLRPLHPAFPIERRDMRGGREQQLLALGVLLLAYERGRAMEGLDVSVTKG